MIGQESNIHPYKERVSTQRITKTKEQRLSKELTSKKGNVNSTTDNTQGHP